MSFKPGTFICIENLDCEHNVTWYVLDDCNGGTILNKLELSEARIKSDITNTKDCQFKECRCYGTTTDKAHENTDSSKK